MLPDEFANQGGDPFLFELYRSVGAAGVIHSITVDNGFGGVQNSVFSRHDASAAPPRYERRPLPAEQIAALLDAARQRLMLASPEAQRRLQVAVAVPTYRTDVEALARIFHEASCMDASVDVR